MATPRQQLGWENIWEVTSQKALRGVIIPMAAAWVVIGVKPYQQWSDKVWMWVVKILTRIPHVPHLWRYAQPQRYAEAWLRHNTAPPVASFDNPAFWRLTGAIAAIIFGAAAAWYIITLVPLILKAMFRPGTPPPAPAATPVTPAPTPPAGAPPVPPVAPAGPVAPPTIVTVVRRQLWPMVVMTIMLLWATGGGPTGMLNLYYGVVGQVQQHSAFDQRTARCKPDANGVLSIAQVDNCVALFQSADDLGAQVRATLRMTLRQTCAVYGLYKAGEGTPEPGTATLSTPVASATASAAHTASEYEAKASEMKEAGVCPNSKSPSAPIWGSVTSKLRRFGAAVIFALFWLLPVLLLTSWLWPIQVGGVLLAWNAGGFWKRLAVRAALVLTVAFIAGLFLAK